MGRDRRWNYKVDFEQHNFGGAELDIVDPAYDLASAIFELAFTEQEEQELLDEYVAQEWRPTIVDRFSSISCSTVSDHETRTYAIARERTGERGKIGTSATCGLVTFWPTA